MRTALTVAALAAAIPVAPRPYAMFGRTYFNTPAADPPAAGQQQQQAPAAGSGPNVEQLRAEFTRVQAEGTQFIATLAAANRDPTAEETTAQEARYARLQQIARTVNDQSRFAGIALASTPGGGAASGGQGGGGQIQLPAAPQGQQQFDNATLSPEDRRLFSNNPGPMSVEQATRRFQAHRQAINHYIRTGQSDRANQFTLTTATGGGVMVPTSTGQPIQVQRLGNAVRAALASRGIVILQTTSTEPFAIPVFDDTANTADVIAQNATGDNPADPAVSGITLGAKLYDSKTVWVPNMLLLAIDFDLLGYIEPMLDDRVDVKQSASWFALLKAASVGVTAATVGGVTYDNLLDWQHSIPVVRRTRGVFFMSDGLFRACRGIKDTTGHPIYQESLRDDAPSRLLGWPIFITDQLDAPGANAVSGVAADAASLKVRDITGGATRYVRYVDNPNWPDQFGLRKFAYGDFAFEAAGVKTLKHPAA